MKYQLLILVTLTGFISCDNPPTNDVVVQETAEGIQLSCKSKKNVTGNGFDQPTVELPYADTNTGEYECGENSKIYVKFRTCDNCVELDTPSLAGLIVGNLVATAIVGVAVYLIASQARPVQVPPTKKRSDRPNRTPNDPSSSSSHYQQLKHGKRDIYDKLGQ